jgi:hypothetical protein
VRGGVAQEEVKPRAIDGEEVMHSKRCLHEEPGKGSAPLFRSAANPAADPWLHHTLPGWRPSTPQAEQSQQVRPASLIVRVTLSWRVRDEPRGAFSAMCPECPQRAGAIHGLSDRDGVQSRRAGMQNRDLSATIEISG